MKYLTKSRFKQGLECPIRLTSNYKSSDENDDFLSALKFVNKTGEICEEEGHHANYELGWGFVKISIWTHKINGLTSSDFVLAAKFDQLKW